MRRTTVLVDVLPGALTSRSILRVAKALRRYAPADVELVAPETPDPDLHVLHVIGSDVLTRPELTRSSRYAVIQYCFKTAGGELEAWQKLWSGAQLTWSYYNLPILSGRFMYSPLGVDENFYEIPSQQPGLRRIGVVTSGFVSGPPAEAIEEVADAALRANCSVFHLGPRGIENMTPRLEESWSNAMNISDTELCFKYNLARYVSGLRYIEGFEMPVVEGFACGAAPIVFSREETRAWFAPPLATHVPECSGEELVERLVEILRTPPAKLADAERERLLAEFNWQVIAERFWKAVL
jgi:hypothetical protein